MLCLDIIFLQLVFYSDKKRYIEWEDIDMKYIDLVKILCINYQKQWLNARYSYAYFLLNFLKVLSMF